MDPEAGHRLVRSTVDLGNREIVALAAGDGAPSPPDLQLPPCRTHRMGPFSSPRIEDGPTSVVREPWSGEEIARVVLADEKRAEDAAAASVRAFDRMRTRSSHERKMVLARIVQEFEARQEAFGELIAREAGKPIAQARTEVTRALATFQLGAEEATRIGGEVMPLDTT